MIVTEDPLFYYIKDGETGFHVQRKQPLKNTDEALSLSERTIILLCQDALRAYVSHEAIWQAACQAQRNADADIGDGLLPGSWKTRLA